jgi:hypothetical protein
MAIAFVNSKYRSVYHILRCVSNDPLRCGLAHCGRVFDEAKMNVEIWSDANMHPHKSPCEKCLYFYQRRLKIYELIEQENLRQNRKALYEKKGEQANTI